eukprot:s205_g3.t1
MLAMAAVSALGNAALPPYGQRLKKALRALHAVRTALPWLPVRVVWISNAYPCCDGWQLAGRALCAENQHFNSRLLVA